MPLFRHTATRVLAEANAGTLVERLATQFVRAYGHEPPPGERRAWQNSLSILAQDLCGAGLGEVEMLIEYQLATTTYRADVILCGVHPGSGRPSYVVLELKQWTAVEPVEGAPDLCSVPGYSRYRLHPAAQVRRYCEWMSDYVRSIDATFAELGGAAYLHNANESAIGWLHDFTNDENTRIFTGATRGGFVDYLRSRLGEEPGAKAADTLLASKIAPGKQLMALAAEEITRREQFVLLDEQQIAYSLVMRAAERARASDTKEVVIVTGGPGSGKSVIALSLLGELNRRGIHAYHASGSRSFTMTLRKVAGHRNRRVQSLFKYFNNFMDAARNGVEVLICDEAHRIRRTSANRFTRSTLRTGRAQVDELLDAARVPVFLLDEHQVVRPGEVGTVASIERAATDKGLQVERIDLTGQFRAGGSAVYDRWVHRLLGLEPGGPIPWEGDPGRFELRVSESPSVMEEELAAVLDHGAGARIAAGFCWPWNDPVDDDLPLDVRIGDWHRPWNAKGDRAVGDAPPSHLWATDENGFGQVGCVYTAQGFEYDWGGVIFGADLVRRDGRWIADLSASRDQELKRGAADFDALVRNVYKVLLTRALRGAVLYSVDPETQAFLRSLVPERV